MNYNRSMSRADDKLQNLITEKLDILRHLKTPGFFADLQSKQVAEGRLSAINILLNRHYIKSKGL